MINPLREGAINRSSEFKFDFSSQLWLIMNPPQTDFRFLSARNLPRPRYRIPPLSPLGEKYFLGKEELSLERKKKHGRTVARACSWGIWRSAYHQRKWYPPPFASLSLFIFIPFLFIILFPLSLSLYLSHTSLWSLEFSGPWILFHSRRFLHMQINPLDLNRARAYSWLTFEYPNLLGR